MAKDKDSRGRDLVNSADGRVRTCLVKDCGWSVQNDDPSESDVRLSDHAKNAHGKK